MSKTHGKLQELGYRVEFSDGTQRSDGGPPGSDGRRERQSVMILSLGPFPTAHTWVTFAHRCSDEGAAAAVLPSGPAAESRQLCPSDRAAARTIYLQLVFDRTFAAPGCCVALRRHASIEGYR
jgi:hypothetical protein